MTAHRPVSNFTAINGENEAFKAVEKSARDNKMTCNPIADDEINGN